jgi:type I restriction enzyme R subunit
MQKTIVFCATEEHAERMRIALNNLNADMVKENPDYVVRITGSDDYGKKKLGYFISVSAKYPVIATTSKLLSTGADCKMTKLIVIDQTINSMTEFKQIIRRGTRLREQDGKTHFTVMDFRGVTRLFADPDWDGPIEIDPRFEPAAQEPKPKQPNPPIVDPEPKPPKPYVDSNGCPVEIINKIVSIFDTNGKLLRKQNIIDYTKTNLLGTYASLENFIQKWTAEQRKATIKEIFRTRHGIDFEDLKTERGMKEVDDFDFICHVAFDQKPLTRKERADNVKKTDFLSKYGDAARKVLEALLDKYMNIGIYEIEDIDILKLDPLKQFGSQAKIVAMFGGKDGYLQAVSELQEELYKVA